MTSSYLTLPSRGEEEVRAEQRAKAEARVLAVRGSYDAPGFEACVDAEMRADSFASDLERIAELGRAAFFKTVSMWSDTEMLMWEARSVIQDLNQREQLSQADYDELLLAECQRLVGGDVLKAQLLASWAKEI